MLTVCVLLIVLVIIGTMTDVSFWFINEIFPKMYLSEIEPIQPLETMASSVKHSINEDEPLINAKSKPKASQMANKKRFIEFVKALQECACHNDYSSTCKCIYKY